MPSTETSSDKPLVDRLNQSGAFDALLDAETRRIMCVWGPTGHGKSKLLQHLRSRSEQLGTDTVFIAWEGSIQPDYMQVMNRVRDETDPEHFGAFDEKVAEFKQQAARSAGASFMPDFTVTDSADVSVELHVTQHLTESSRGLWEDNNTIFEVTRAFMPCLQKFVADRRLVIFFDTMEKASETTEDWLWNHFLDQLRGDEFGNVKCVLAGRKQFVPEPAFDDYAGVHELDSFSSKDVIEFLSKYGFPALAKLPEFVGLILAQTSGSPKEVAEMVANYRGYVKRETDA